MFVNPHYLWLLLIIPILIILYIIKEIRGERDAIHFSLFSIFKKIKKRSVRAYTRHTLFLFQIIVIALCIVLIARPRIQGDVIEKESKEGIDIVLVLDVSRSMLAEDMTPNRIEAAKKVTENFIRKIENDRLSIVVFAGRAFTQVPLTFDYTILQEYIKNISTESIKQDIRGLGGTAIGLALSSASLKFDEESKERTKVIILMTDGESNMGPSPVTVADYLREKSMKIYTIGIGKDRTPIPIIDRFGNKIYARNTDGSLLLSSLDEKTLKDIAEMTDGKYFRATDKKTLAKVYEVISKLEKKELITEKEIQYEEDIKLFAWIILLLLLLKFILRETWFRVIK